MKLDPATRRELQDVSEILGKGTLASSDYGELREDFKRILAIYYPQS